MAIAPVRKIHIVAHRSAKDGLLDVLQKMGVVEIHRSEIAPERKEAGGEERSLEASLRRIDDTIRLLRPFLPALPLAERIYPVRPSFREEDLLRLVDGFDLDGFLAACERISGELEELRGALGRLDEERQTLGPWAGLDAPPALLHGTSQVEVTAGRLPLSEGRAFKAALEEVGAVVEPAREDERSLHALVICLKDCGPAIRAVMAAWGFQEIRLPSLDVTPAERLAAIELERVRLGERIRALRKSYRDLASRREELLVLRDVVAARLERLRAERLLGFTGATVSLEGWVPARQLAEVRRRLERRFPLVTVGDYDPEPHERVPVILENRPLVTPFGLVVDLYGLPRYGAVDPSAVMAAFFAVFFGLCLTDAGYGLFLAAVTGTLLALAPRPLPPSRRRFLRMFFLCGLATVAAGAAAGGWFGLSVPWRLFDPLEDLMLFALLALGVGTLHLFAGIALRMVRLVRAGNLFAAAVDHGLWMLLVVALFGTAAGGALPLPDVAAGLFASLAVVAAIGIVFFQGRPDDAGEDGWRNAAWAVACLCAALWFRGHLKPWSGLAALLILAADPVLPGGSVKKLLSRLGLGLYALYGITGYLSDILSYSRLVALGLGTGIVALVVNKMAGVALGAPGVGIVAAGAVLVFGHLFNILINLLGAFVHSCRLQYVEFFTKFYESGGKPFTPFRLGARYITIEEQTQE